MALSGLFLMLAAGAAEAQNRTNAHVRETFFTARGFTRAQIDRYATFGGQPDQAVLPGIIYSAGVMGSSYGNQGTTLWSARLYNESRVTFCVRAKGQARNPMRNPRTAGNLGVDFLITPGSSEALLINTEDRVVNGEFAFDVQLYLWLADMTAPAGRRCASTAPADLESWARAPLANGMHRFDRRLLVAMGLAEPYIPGTTTAALRLADYMRGLGVTVDPAGENVEIVDIQSGSRGLIEHTAAVAVVPGWRHNVLVWIQNGHDRAFCAIRRGPEVIVETMQFGDVFAPQRGFYLPAGSGRQVAILRVDPGRTQPVDLDVNYLFWFPPNGETTDLGCETSAPAELYDWFGRQIAGREAAIYFAGEADAVFGQ
jgi:hypothetical protein